MEDSKSASCRETPGTGRSDGWRAKAKKEKDRLRKRKERMRKDHPQEGGAPVPPTIILPTAHPLPSPCENARDFAIPGSGETVASFLPRQLFRRNGVGVPAQRHPPSRARRQNGGTIRHRACPVGMKKLGNERNHARHCRSHEMETQRECSDWCQEDSKKFSAIASRNACILPATQVSFSGKFSSQTILSSRHLAHGDWRTTPGTLLPRRELPLQTHAMQRPPPSCGHVSRHFRRTSPVSQLFLPVEAHMPSVLNPGVYSETWLSVPF